MNGIARAAAIVAALAVGTDVLADGGTLRVSQRSGSLQVSVFTRPAVLRVGMIDVSVLVQEDQTGAVRADLPIRVRMESIEQPDLVLQQEATVAAATNKLFQAAQLEIPRAGAWRTEVLIDDDQPLEFELAIGPPIPAWLELAPWVGWPIGAVLLFGAHQVLVARRSSHEFRYWDQVARGKRLANPRG